MPDILVSENVSGAEMDDLKKKYQVVYEPELFKDQNKLMGMIGDFRAIVVRNQTKVNADLIAAGKKLQVIGRAGVGLDNVDHVAASSAGIVVAFAPMQNSISVAELAIGLMISMARMIPAADKSTKAGGWDRKKFTGVELFGKTLGIVGLGRIGFLVANRAKAFGMKIIAHDNFVNPDSFTVSEIGAELVSLDELFKRADVISVHTPETPQTAKMFNAAAFAKMKPTAFFMNTSRGGVVDEEALIEALRSKKIAGAALDVRSVEPPKPSPLTEMENVILMPHVAAFTNEGQDRVQKCVCADVDAVLSGRPAMNYFNFAMPKKNA
ncbi:MAG TPA: hydroxyacid dehydrogenase [Tepidisphaeraceae bacterium]